MVRPEEETKHRNLKVPTLQERRRLDQLWGELTWLTLCPLGFGGTQWPSWPDLAVFRARSLESVWWAVPWEEAENPGPSFREVSLQVAFQLLHSGVRECSTLSLME